MALRQSGSRRGQVGAAGLGIALLQLRVGQLQQRIGRLAGVGPQIEHTLDLLSPTGSSGGTKLEAIGVFSGLVRLLAKAERDEQQAASSIAEARTQQLHAAAADGNHPRLAEALAETSSGRTTGDEAVSDQDQFGRILGRVLTGLLTG